MFNSKEVYNNYCSKNETESSAEHGVIITSNGLVCAQDLSKSHNDDMLFRDDYNKILKFNNKKESLRWINNNIKDRDIHPLDKNCLLKNNWQKQFMK